MDLALNIFFGVVGVVGFLFALWQWRQSEKVRDLFERTLEAIAQNAGDYAQNTDTMSARLFASQVQKQCYALVGSKAKIGHYFVRFFPAEESSYWLTGVGKYVTESVDRRGMEQLRLKLEGEAPRDGTEKLVYGPYETLPLTGTYRVTFGLKVTPPKGADGATPVLRLDVNGSNPNQRPAERFYSADDLTKGQKSFELTFRYSDLREKLEYRVSLLKKGTAGSIYDVTLERTGR